MAAPGSLQLDTTQIKRCLAQVPFTTAFPSPHQGSNATPLLIPGSDTGPVLAHLVSSGQTVPPLNYSPVTSARAFPSLLLWPEGTSQHQTSPPAEPAPRLWCWFCWWTGLASSPQGGRETGSVWKRYERIWMMVAIGEMGGNCYACCSKRLKSQVLSLHRRRG